MTADFRLLFSDPVFRRRLFVTLAVLFALRAGYSVPLPLLSVALSPDPSNWRNVVSVFAIGLTSFYTALILLEFVKMGWPSLRRWENQPRNAGKLARWTFLAALALSAVHSYVLVQNLKALPLAYGAPENTLAATVSLVAGTALVGWLIRIISFHGLGNGFWVLYAAQQVSGLPLSAERSWVQWQFGILDISALALGAGFLLAAVAVLVTAVLPWHYSRTGMLKKSLNEFQASETLAATIWPPLFAAFAGSALMTAVTPLWERYLPAASLIPVQFCLSAVLVLLFTALYQRPDEALTASADDEVKPVWMLALIQATLFLAAAAWSVAVPLPFFVNATSIIVFVAVSIDVLAAAAALQRDRTLAPGSDPR